jgi:hypothetical protein
MRSRAIDIALLLGLVAVAGAIMWTLFNLGGGPRVAPSPAPASPAAPADPGGDPGRVVPVAPGGGPDGGQAPGGQGLGQDPDAQEPDAQEPAPGAPAVGAPDADAPGAQAPGDAQAAADDPDVDADGPAPDAAPVPGQPAGGADAAPPVPTGTVDVDRLGFSFVTGGPGACGLVLEAWTHVAVSRELLAAYGCGARVRVTLDDAAGDRSSFEGVVGDTMNPQFARTVNVYVGEDEPALEYGVTSGTITPLD